MWRGANANETSTCAMGTAYLVRYSVRQLDHCPDALPGFGFAFVPQAKLVAHHDPHLVSKAEERNLRG